MNCWPVAFHPLLLPPEVGGADALLQPIGEEMRTTQRPAEKMECFAVDPRVGNVKNDDAALLILIAA